jgi:hypothetical protein
MSSNKPITSQRSLFPVLNLEQTASVPIERNARWAQEMVWALWGIEKFLDPASSLVATQYHGYPGLKGLTE